jgi:hypothetical protein
MANKDGLEAWRAGRDFAQWVKYRVGDFWRLPGIYTVVLFARGAFGCRYWSWSKDQ